MANLSKVESHALEWARMRIMRSRVVVNIDLREQVFGDTIVKSLLKSGRLYNMFEIAYSGEASNPGQLYLRAMLEFKIYTGKPDVQSILSGMSLTERPNYGIVDYFSDPIGISMLGRYGWYRFVLEEGVNKRSTFSPNDSLQITASQVFTLDDIDGVLASRPIKDGRYWFEYINRREVPIDENGNPRYIEAQILGGVFLDDDVEALWYPETAQYDKIFFSKLKRLRKKFNITAFEHY